MPWIILRVEERAALVRNSRKKKENLDLKECWQQIDLYIRYGYRYS